MSIELLERPNEFPGVTDPNLLRSLTRLTAEPALDLASMDYTIENKARFYAAFGKVVPFFHGVEGRTGPEYAPQLMNARPNHPILKYYFPTWINHEMAHSGLFAGYMTQTGMPELVGTKITGELTHPQAASFLLAISQGFDNIFDWNAGSTTDLNEYMTGTAYNRLHDRAVAIGEVAFARNVRKAGVQEAFHLNVGTTFTKYVEREQMGYKPELSNKVPWQLGVARRIFRHGMRAVGVKDYGEEVMSAMILDLTNNAPKEFAMRVNRRAQLLLDDNKDSSFIDFFNVMLKKVAARRFLRSLG